MSKFGELLRQNDEAWEAYSGIGDELDFKEEITGFEVVFNGGESSATFKRGETELELDITDFVAMIDHYAQLMGYVKGEVQ